MGFIERYLRSIQER